MTTTSPFRSVHDDLVRAARAHQRRRTRRLGMALGLGLATVTSAAAAVVSDFDPLGGQPLPAKMQPAVGESRSEVRLPGDGTTWVFSAYVATDGGVCATAKAEDGRGRSSVGCASPFVLGDRQLTEVFLDITTLDDPRDGGGLVAGLAPADIDQIEIVSPAGTRDAVMAETAVSVPRGEEPPAGVTAEGRERFGRMPLQIRGRAFGALLEPAIAGDQVTIVARRRGTEVGRISIRP